MLPICSSRGDQARVSALHRLSKAAGRGCEFRRLGWRLVSLRLLRQWPADRFVRKRRVPDRCARASLGGAIEAAPADRAEMAVRAAEEHLVCQKSGMIRLLTPPFDRTPNDPGYIKGYLPGIRENGGQYTHGVLWLVRAVAEMGRGTQAVELFKMLSPVSHSELETARPDLSNRTLRRGGRCLRRTAPRWPRRLDLVYRIGGLDVSSGGRINIRCVDRGRTHADRQSIDLFTLAPMSNDISFARRQYVLRHLD